MSHESVAMRGISQYELGSLLAEVGRNRLDIYVTSHCGGCIYAREVADDIRRRYPDVSVTLIDMETTAATIPDEVFATPTYVLDGQIWSLGNPSDEKIRNAFGER